VRCQSSTSCQNPIAHSCDQCGHLVCDQHREVLSQGDDHGQVTCSDCTPKARARLRDLPGIRGQAAGKPETGWLFDDENTAVIGEPLRPELDGVPRRGETEPDSAPAGGKSWVEWASDKRASLRRSSVRKSSGNKVPDKTAPDKTVPGKTAPDKTAPGKTAPVALKEEIQGPLIILTVLAAIVAIVGGIAGNSFLALAGGLMSGAALLAVIILGLTTPK
jgi:hypothetical protein